MTTLAHLTFMKQNLADLQPARVLLVRLGTVRDAMMTIPLAVDIKRLWPTCELSWIVDDGIAELLETHPAIDQVIRIDRKWARQPQQWQSIRSLLVAKQYELVLDPQSSLKSALLAWMSGCKHRVGFDRSAAKEFAWTLHTHHVQPVFRHRVDRYRELMQAWMPVHAREAEFELPSSFESSSKLDAKLAENQIDRSGWCIVHPGAIWPTAVWPMERIGQIASHLFQDYQLKSLIVQHNDQDRLIAGVLAEQHGDCVQVAPELSLMELIELTRRCKLVITGDTDLLQVASAVGAACISLHGPTWADEFAAYHFVKFAIQSPYPMNYRKRMRSGSNAPMLAIEVEELMISIQRLLRFAGTQPLSAVA